ncbi:delta-aminolevulinic acid dehydratase [Spirochaetota bacterium]|nr:delta-aminolevulinic acid dehydratase [Spirochaetota bacterium]
MNKVFSNKPDRSNIIGSERKSNTRSFLTHRPRRLRQNAHLRELVQETTLHATDFIMPVFVRAGRNIKNPIAAMPGIFQFSPDTLLKELETYLKVDLKAIILFGIPAHKDTRGSDALSNEGIIAKTVTIIKKQFPALIVITDCCFCEYTSHGHCGHIDIPTSTENAAGTNYSQQGNTTHPNTTITVDNDKTLVMLGKQALIHAEAGCDMIAPSGMMDGMVGAIRTQLDQHGFIDIPIMSYAVKYASAFYGPFREAASSMMRFGDRKSYQMNPANSREALHEATLDIDEGADILMVKPALPYLDIVKGVRAISNLPVAAYQVSGEYAMIKAAAEKNWIDERLAIIESLTAIKRAGADLIISYFAYDVLNRLKNNSV